MTIGRVDKVCFSRTKKPQVMIAGRYYWIESHHGLTEGMTIDFDERSWQYNGKTFYGIGAWGPAKEPLPVPLPIPQPTNGSAVLGQRSEPRNDFEQQFPAFSHVLGCALRGAIITKTEELMPFTVELKKVFDYWGRAQVDRMAQIADKSAFTKKANEYSGRILDAIRAGNESSAITVWKEAQREGDETFSTAVWAAIPTTVQQRLQDLTDEQALHGKDPDDVIEF